jgi:ribosome recycling factor
MQELLQESDRKMKSAIEAMVRDFGRIRTGRANPTVLENITISYYGVDTPIPQCANISVPEPRQLLIQPYDKGTGPQIMKAIQTSDLGVTPIDDGNGIRLNFPPMTEERRKEMIKQVHVRTEECIVAIRNVRHHAMNTLKDKLKAKEISEDEEKGFEKKIQELTDKHVAETHTAQKKKDAELMEI